MRAPIRFTTLSAQACVRILALLLSLFTAFPAVPLGITITSGAGGWTVTAPAPTVAGTNFAANITSANNQTVLAISGPFTGGYTRWRVTVHKVDSVWNSDLALRVRRRSNGNPTGHLSGGTGYITVPDGAVNAVQFFRSDGQTAVSNIQCALRITGVDDAAMDGVSTNTTTIYYTVVEY